MNIKINEVIKDFNKSKVYYDPAFQRRTVWLALINGAPYIESLSDGTACSLSKIVIVDVRRSLQRAIATGVEESVEYFESVLANGFEYISIDGQNRTKFIESFFNNEVPISGTFTDADGKKVEVTNKFFKDFPQRLQDGLKMSEVDISLLVVESRHKLSGLFERANSGVALNNQEKRNAMPTPISQLVRETSKALGSALKKVVRDADVSRMLDDEHTAHMIMALLGDHYGLSDREVDDFYREGLTFFSLDDVGFPYSKGELQRVEKVLSNWKNTILQQTLYTGKKKVPKYLSWAVLYACTWAYDNGYMITDREEFFGLVKAIDDKLTVDSENDYSAARSQALRSGKDPKMVSKSGYYFNWSGLPHQTPARNRRIAELCNEFAKNTTKMSLRLRNTNKNNQVISPLECESLG
jgi:hypothetical protein